MCPDVDVLEIGWGDTRRAHDVVGVGPILIASDDDVARGMLGGRDRGWSVAQASMTCSATRLDGYGGQDSQKDGWFLTFEPEG